MAPRSGIVLTFCVQGCYNIKPQHVSYRCHIILLAFKSIYKFLSIMYQNVTIINKAK